MAGFNHAADALGQSVADAMGGIAAEAAAATELRRMQKIAANVEELELSNAGNLAEKHALREALAKLDPNHPLLQNVMLQEKIKEAGKRALAMTQDWDAARRAGSTFKY
jgi:hypothetical protein